MAEPGAMAGLEELLTCPICLGVYRDPVSLVCGHSFCKACVQEARSHRPGPFTCPLCSACADPAMELQPNVQLRSIVQKFLEAPARQEEGEREGQREEEGENLGQGDKVIPCDFCLQKPQPAVKTCLSCEASLCQAHLSKHSTKSLLKDHVLIEPCDVHLLAERRCPQHGKLLECYCRTDSVCICVLCCVASPHREHKIDTLEEAFGQEQSVFPETLEAVKEHEAALNQSIANLLKQEEEVKAKESLLRDQLESLFKEMCLQLDNEKREVLKALSHNEEQQLSQIQMEVQKHKEEKDAASCDIQELEALRDQKDLLLFMKSFAAIRARKRKQLANKDGVELPRPPIILDKLTTDTTLRLFRQFLSDMQSLLEVPPVQEHLTYSTHLRTTAAYNTNVVTAPQSSYVHFGWTPAMAKAKEEFGGGASLEDELSCPICLCLYRNPVSLSCGHSFCKQCIQKALGAQQQSKTPYSCPMCKLQLGPILELQKNFQLCSIVEAFLASTSKGQQAEGSAEEEEEEEEVVVVPCDFCLDRFQPATIMCLNCDASLCQAHLNKHNAKASQQHHMFIEVGAGDAAEGRRCPEHGRLLECYCQDEGQHICTLCSIVGCHKGHSIITLKEAHEKQLGELSDIVTWLQERKSALDTALEELQRSKNQLKTNTKTVTSQLQKLFEEMNREMMLKEKMILSDIQFNEKKQLADITKVKKEVEQRRDEAAQHLQSLQKMRAQQDIFLFFKEFKLATDRVASQNFGTSRMDVEVVQLDQARIDHYRRLTGDFMSRLDSLLQGVQSELSNQIKQNSGSSDTGASSNLIQVADNGWKAQEACSAAQNQRKGSVRFKW